MKIISVVGARPNFMKIAPFIRAIEDYNTQGSTEKIKHILVHTGQHYDDRMSNSFFETLKIPAADINLGIGSGTHAEQVGNTMIEFEKVLRNERPDWVVVVGDVNATLACSVTAKKEHIKVCHIEAGLRSGDITMPEEVNRLVTDRLSDLLLIPDLHSGQNLVKEGTPEKNIVFVGNIMIDTLEANRDKAAGVKLNDIITNNLISPNLPISHSPNHSARRSFSEGGPFALLTLHRPSNVDTMEVLEPIVNFLKDEVAEDMPLIWTIHPRTESRLKEFGLWDRITSNDKIFLLQALGYHEMLKLNMEARVLLTDSGGLQEECTVLGTPCLTLRWNTERPITLRKHGGASILVGNNIGRIREEYQKTLALERTPFRPELWDGKTAGRCLRAILNYK
jgi:UDP-N-acetylglucosamine 2-epimerase (non-hydrolysing)